MLNESGQSLLAFGPAWKWDVDRKIAGRQARRRADGRARRLHAPRGAGRYDVKRSRSISGRSSASQRGKSLLERSIRLETPEAIVNDAWRADADRQLR